MPGLLPTDDPILTRFRAALDELYGDRAERGRVVRLAGARQHAGEFRLRFQA
jgi:hypothetical protein